MKMNSEHSIEQRAKSKEPRARSQEPRVILSGVEGCTSQHETFVQSQYSVIEAALSGSKPLSALAGMVLHSAGESEILPGTGQPGSWNRKNWSVTGQLVTWSQKNGSGKAQIMTWSQKNIPVTGQPAQGIDSEQLEVVSSKSEDRRMFQLATNSSSPLLKGVATKETGDEINCTTHDSQLATRNYLKRNSTVNNYIHPQRRVCPDDLWVKWDCIYNASSTVPSNAVFEAEGLAFRACELLLN